MMLILKKKTVLIATALVLAVILAIVLAIGFSAAASAESVDKITVVVDAGHGGHDGGVQGKTTGIKESDINLTIAKALKGFLEDNGYRVVMTRNSEEGLYGMTKQNRKLRDMEARKAIIAEANPDLVVSIHQNAFPGSSVKGPQVFSAPHSETGRTYAATMQSTLNTSLSSNRAPKTGDYYILQCSSAPSLLVECGFLSNPEEEMLLVTAVYQQKVAFAIYSAINTILSPPASCT